MAEREQNWYPISRIGYFTDLVREGIDVTRGQIELFTPAMAEPYRLDDATVNRAARVYENQRADQVLFRNQADRWAGEVATAAEKAALTTYVAVLDELDQLTADVLGMCATLSQQTIEKLMSKSDEEAVLEALMRLARDGRICR
ncbi:hypothetical protein [Nocardia amamiensis]|uniref:hypothetical protein n=1 Tax=Nocardia amamiensis TaxID=404578 RepID=UPI000833931B|nr:hypothetical protein [Nocardia amamiensis]